MNYRRVCFSKFRSFSWISFRFKLQ